MNTYHDVAHLRRIGKEQLDLATGEPRFPARRWVVERTLAWLSKCRVLLMRFEHAANFADCSSSPVPSSGIAACIAYPC